MSDSTLNTPARLLLGRYPANPDLIGNSQGRNHQPVVYYVTSEYGGVVKIGCTNNLARRMHTLSRKRVRLHVIACEWGDTDLEKRRHYQFGHIAQRSDFFWLTDEFREHIERVGCDQDFITWAFTKASEVYAA